MGRIGSVGGAGGAGGGGHGGRASLGFWLVASAAVAWGTTGVAVKFIFQETDLGPLAVTWLRAALATPIVLLIAWRALGRDLFAASRRDLTIMVSLGVLFIFEQWFYVAAVERIGVSASTLIALCVPPALVAAASTVVLREPLHLRLAAALIGALLGTVLLVGGPELGEDSAATAVGVLLALGTAVGIAIHTVASRSIAARHHAIRPLAIAFPVGALVFLPVAIGGGLPGPPSPVGWSLLLYLAVVPSILATWMFQRGLRDVPATPASIVTLLEPLAATALAWLLFGERLGPLGLAGGALLLGSIALLSVGVGPAGRRVSEEPVAL